MVAPARLLLSPELRQRVHNKITECLVKARAEYPSHAFEEPEVRFDVKNTDGGLAYGNDWLIRFNLVLCYENEDHFVETTVPHEVAHLIARRVHGFVRKNAAGELMFNPVTKKPIKIRSHGREWQEVMAVLGAKASRTHSYVLTSVATPKKRSKRGSVISAQDAESMIRRLQNGIKRLPDPAKLVFQDWLHEHINEEEES